MSGSKLVQFIVMMIQCQNDAIYTGCAKISRENIMEQRNKFVSENKITLQKVSDCDRLSLTIQFNPAKIQSRLPKKHTFVVHNPSH